MTARAQSSIVGVAVLLAVAVVSIAALTVAVGSVIDEGASEAASQDVAASIDDAFDTERSGSHTARLPLYDGRLRTVERSVRILDGPSVAFEYAVDGLVFTAADREVRYLSGATIRSTGGNAAFYTPPPITTRNRSLFLNVATLDTTSVAVDGATAVTLRTNVTHDRRELRGRGTAIAIETRTPAVWERWFESTDATTTRRDIDDDGVPSVVARFPNVRSTYVFVHDLHLEVGR